MIKICSIDMTEQELKRTAENKTIFMHSEIILCNVSVVILIIHVICMINTM